MTQAIDVFSQNITQNILPVHKADSAAAETAGLPPALVTENGSGTGLTPVQLTTDEDPRCMQIQICG